MSLLQKKTMYDTARIAELYEQHWLTILLSIRQYLPRREDAEDVLLAVFLAAMENEKFFTLEADKQLLWLRRVAYNKAIDFHRGVARHRSVSLDDATEMLFADEDYAPDQIATRGEEYALLQAHIATLPAAQQEVLRLRFAGDLRCSEIAQRMHKSEGAIRTLLSRTLNFLRTIYAEGQEEKHHG